MKKRKIYSIFLAALLILCMKSVSISAEQEATSMLCDNGTVNIGDYDVDVQNKCGQPSSRQMNVWVYNFGPSQPVYTLIFDEGKLVRILEDQWGS